MAANRKERTTTLGLGNHTADPFPLDYRIRRAVAILTQVEVELRDPEGQEDRRTNLFPLKKHPVAGKVRWQLLVQYTTLGEHLRPGRFKFHLLLLSRPFPSSFFHLSFLFSF